MSRPSRQIYSMPSSIERWRDVPGIPSTRRFQASNLGRVRGERLHRVTREPTGRWVVFTPQTHRGLGVPCLLLKFGDGNRKLYLCRQLVRAAWFPEFDNKTEVMMCDDNNPFNLRLSNLQIIARSEVGVYLRWQERAGVLSQSWKKSPKKAKRNSSPSTASSTA